MLYSTLRLYGIHTSGLFTVNQYHKSEETLEWEQYLVMQMMEELEKSLTMEVLVRTGIIKGGENI